MKLKILYIFSTNILSGAEYVTCDFIKTDTQNDYFLLVPDIKEIYDFVSKYVSQDKIYITKWLRLQNVTHTTGIQKIFRILKKLISIFIVRMKIKRLEKRLGLDLIIGHNTQDGIFFYKSNTKKILQVFDQIEKKSHLEFIIKTSVSKTSHYIVDSKSIKDDLIRTGVKPSKISIVYNGVNQKISCARSLKEYKEAGLLWIGSFEDRKDPVEFFKILELLMEVNFPFCAHMVYRKTDLEYYNSGLNYLEKLKKYKNIFFYESLPREMLESLYLESDILFCTSKSDSPPTIIIEAFSYGLPVIARSIRGVDEIVISGKNGFLYEDIKEIPEMISNILENYTYFSENSLQTLRQRFSPEVKLKKMLNIFEEVLPGKSISKS